MQLRPDPGGRTYTYSGPPDSTAGCKRRTSTREENGRAWGKEGGKWRERMKREGGERRDEKGGKGSVV